MSASSAGAGSGFHGFIEGVAAAAGHCRSRVALAALPPETRFRNRLRLPPPVWARVRALLQHGQLPRAVRACAGSDLVVVREFLTLPLLLAAPRLLRQRRRLVLTLTHNLQQADRRRLHRAVLRALLRSGLGFCCLESEAGFAEALSPGPGQDPLVLPHVVPEEAGCDPEPRGGGRPRLGVVGVPRPEKNVEPLLERLLALRAGGALEAELLLGSPDSELRARWASRVDAAVNTRGRVAYEAALRRCDVVAFDYSELHYRLRSSAVVTDAVVQGCAVVCPDLPVLRAQVTVPRPVGALFRSPGEQLPAIGRALALRRDDPGAFRAYRRARSPRAVAGRLDDWVRARLPGPAHG